MRILQISRVFPPSVGGIESVVYGLSRALAERGLRCDILTLRQLLTTGEVLGPDAEVDGLHVFRVPHIGIKRYPIAPSVLSFVPSYDILHVHAIDFFVDFLGIMAAKHRKPIVVNTHGGIFHTQWLLPFKRLYFKVFTRLSLRAADAVICVSNHDRELFRTIVASEKLHTIPNGVDVQPFLGVQKQIVPGMILGIGRIVENKGVERLIKLLSLAAADFPHVRLVWVGHDSEGRIPGLCRYAQELGVGGRVEFTGKLAPEQMRKLLAQAHLFASAASYEAFGVSTIEAMSSGTVPVVTAVGVHPDVIRDGENGFLWELEVEHALARLHQVLSLDGRRLEAIGQNARESARRFSWSTVVDSYLAIYSNVLSGQ